MSAIIIAALIMLGLVIAVIWLCLCDETSPGAME
jgi:hypothetical protein